MRVNNKGVTMMLLVLTIILMIMIAFLAVYYSQNIAPEARVATAYSSLKTIRDTCKGVFLIYDSSRDEYYYFGKNIREEHSAEINDYAKRCGLSDSNEFGERTYVLDPFSIKEEDKRRLKNLELSNLNSIFVVDLDNDKYYLVDGVTRIDYDLASKVYEYQDIQRMYDMIKSYGDTGMGG